MGRLRSSAATKDAQPPDRAAPHGDEVVGGGAATSSDAHATRTQQHRPSMRRKQQWTAASAAPASTTSTTTPTMATKTASSAPNNNNNNNSNTNNNATTTTPASASSPPSPHDGGSHSAAHAASAPPPTTPLAATDTRSDCPPQTHAHYQPYAHYQPMYYHVPSIPPPRPPPGRPHPQGVAAMPPKQLTAYIKAMYDPAKDHVRTAMRQGHATHHASRHGSVGAAHPAAPAIQSFVSSMSPVWCNGRLNSIHLAAIMTRLAYLVQDGRLEGHAEAVPGLPQMLAHVEACFAQLPPSTDHQSLTNLLWASAKLGHTPSPAFVQGVLDSLTRLGLSSVEPQGLSNVVWALGKMDTSGVHGLHQSLDAIMDAVLAKAPQLCPQDISNLLYGLASMGPVRYHPHPPVLEAMAEAALRHMGLQGPAAGGKGTFTPQGIGNTLWAYAKLGHNPLHGRLVHTMIGRLATHLDSFPSQELVNSLWGAATLHPPGVPVKLLQRVESHAAARLPSCLPLQVSALLSSFATLRYAPHSGAFTNALDATLSAMRTPHASIQVLANVTLAMGKLQLPTTPTTRERLAAHAAALRPSSAAHQRPTALLHLHHGLALLHALDPAAFLELQTALQPHAGAIAEADWQALHLMACVAGVPQPPTPPLEDDDDELIWQAGPARRHEGDHCIERIDLDAVWQAGSVRPETRRDGAGGGGTAGAVGGGWGCAPPPTAPEGVVGSPDLEPDWGCLWQAGPPAPSLSGVQDVLTALQTRLQEDDDVAGIWQLGPPPTQPDLGLLLLQYAATLPGAARSVHALDTNPVRYIGPLTARALEAWVAWQRATPQPACCDAVEDILKLLGLTYVRGYWTEQGIRVDFLVRTGTLRVALVCCGRDEYAVNDASVLVCATKILKHRALERGGYRVAVLDEHQWAQQSAGENVIMLLGVLSAAGVDLEAASPALMHAYRQVQRNTQFL